MTERVFRYLVTALLIFPCVALIDIIAHPVSYSVHDLREILYLLFSIPIALLFYCAWFQPQITREMFGPFRPESSLAGEAQLAESARRDRRDLLFVSFGLGVILICGFQVALGWTAARKFGLFPVTKSPTSDSEITRMAAAATHQAFRLWPTVTPMPTWASPTPATTLTPASALVETPLAGGDTPTVEAALTDTPWPSPQAGMYGVGEQGVVNGIGVTIWDAFTSESIITATATSGNIYLVVEVSIENVSRAAEMPYAPTDIIIQDANGTEYQADSISMEPPLGSGIVATGSTANGYVTFEVPVTASGFIANYNPGDLLEGNPPLQFDLGL